MTPHADPRAFRASLLPLLYRRISLAYCQRSEQYARQRARVGCDVPLPIPALREVLAVYLVQSLPAWAVAGLGLPGVFRLARAMPIGLYAFAVPAIPFFWLARLAWRILRQFRRRAVQPPAAAVAPHEETGHASA